MSQEDVLGEGIVEKPPSTANNSLALATNIVGETKTRREIIQIFVVKLAEWIYIASSAAYCWIKLVEEVYLQSNSLPRSSPNGYRSSTAGER